MIRIVTDSGADILKEEAGKLGVDVVQLTINTEEGSFIAETEEEVLAYYKRLEKMKNLPYTSQPSPEDFLKIFNSYNEGDEVLYIGISSKISGTYNSSRIARDISELKERIHLIDSLSGIEGLKILVWEAVRLRDMGKDLNEIKKRIEELKGRIKIYGLVDSLKYLRKGGRIPKSIGIIGDFLNIKPLVELVKGELISKGKARGRKLGEKLLLNELKGDKIDGNFGIHIGYTGDLEIVRPFVKEIERFFKDIPYYISPIGGIIGTHVGPNCLCLAYITE